MNFLEKLDLYLETNNISKKRFAEISGVQYGTIMSWYSQGFENLKISNIKKIATVTKLSCDYWIMDDMNDLKPLKDFDAVSLTDTDEKKLITNYRELADDVQFYIRGITMGFAMANKQPGGFHLPKMKNGSEQVSAALNKATPEMQILIHDLTEELTNKKRG